MGHSKHPIAAFVGQQVLPGVAEQPTLAGAARIGRATDEWRSEVRPAGAPDDGPHRSDHQVAPAAPVLTLAAFLAEEWLPAKKATVKASTWESYEMMTSAYVATSSIASAPLDTVDGRALTILYGELLAHGRRTTGAGLSPKTVRNLHAMLHKAFNDGVRWGRLGVNPADAAERPRGRTKDRRVWTAHEMRAFLDAVRGEWLFAGWQLLATTGMRRGEVLGLRWCDVDLERATLTIRQTRVSVRYVVETTTPKSFRGSRTIALDDRTVAALSAHRARDQRAAGDDGDLVFVRRDGLPIHPQRFTEWFNHIVARAGLPTIRLHDVRHSYATLLIRQQVPVKVVSQRIGHSDPSITMSVYQAVLPGDDERAALVGANEIFGVAIDDADA